MLDIVDTHTFYDRPVAGIARVFQSRYVFFILIDVEQKDDVFGFIYLSDHLMFQLLMNKIGVRTLMQTEPLYKGYWDKGHWTVIRPEEKHLPTEDWMYNENV